MKTLHMSRSDTWSSQLLDKEWSTVSTLRHGAADASPVHVAAKPAYVVLVWGLGSLQAVVSKQGRQAPLRTAEQHRQPRSPLPGEQLSPGRRHPHGGPARPAALGWACQGPSAGQPASCGHSLHVHGDSSPPQCVEGGRQLQGDSCAPPVCTPDHAVACPTWHRVLIAVCHQAMLCFAACHLADRQGIDEALASKASIHQPVLQHSTYAMRASSQWPVQWLPAAMLLNLTDGREQVASAGQRRHARLPAPAACG